LGSEWSGTVVIGGGQAGLAVGHYLRQQGRDFVILEAGPRVGDTWRGRWDSLRLFTPASFDGLPGMPFPAHRGYFPTKDEMADYLEAYAARSGLPIQVEVRVDRLGRAGERYLITACARLLEAYNVVVATGAAATPYVPAFADRLDPGIAQLHSIQYRDPGQLRDGPALVVGAGNSGAEIGLDLAPRHRVWLAGRDVGHIPVLGGFVYSLMRRITVDTRLGRTLAAKGSGGGDPLGRVRPGDLDEAGVRGGLPVLEDGRVLDVDNVVWCTGFTRDYRWIELPVFDAAGAPIHHRGVVPGEPGLYFVGLPFQSSLTSHLVGGVGADARYIAERIAGRTRPADGSKREMVSSKRDGGGGERG
jgi:putative flavoprotein involved in K+ transport